MRIVSDKAARRARWILGSITGAALIVGGAIRLRARHSSAEADAPADVGFMRALHAALRRDFPEVPWLPFEAWARAQDWKKLLAG